MPVWKEIGKDPEKDQSTLAYSNADVLKFLS